MYTCQFSNFNVLLREKKYVCNKGLGGDQMSQNGKMQIFQQSLCQLGIKVSKILICCILQLMVELCASVNLTQSLTPAQDLYAHYPTFRTIMDIKRSVQGRLHSVTTKSNNTH